MKGGGEALQPKVQAVQRIPPGIQQMQAHHSHHHHKPIYNIDPDAGRLIPPPPPSLPASRPPAYTTTPRATRPQRHGSQGQSRRG